MIFYVLSNSIEMSFLNLLQVPLAQKKTSFCFSHLSQSFASHHPFFLAIFSSFHLPLIIPLLFVFCLPLSTHFSFFLISSILPHTFFPLILQSPKLQLHLYPFGILLYPLAPSLSHFSLENLYFLRFYFNLSISLKLTHAFHTYPILFWHSALTLPFPYQHGPNSPTVLYRRQCGFLFIYIYMYIYAHTHIYINAYQKAYTHLWDLLENGEPVSSDQVWEKMVKLNKEKTVGSVTEDCSDKVQFWVLISQKILLHPQFFIINSGYKGWVTHFLRLCHVTQLIPMPCLNCTIGCFSLWLLNHEGVQ